MLFDERIMGVQNGVRYFTITVTELQTDTAGVRSHWAWTDMSKSVWLVAEPRAEIPRYGVP